MHVQSIFANWGSDKYGDFERHLIWYMNIVAPLIRSLWSLEAVHANALDVFVFWLAAGATLNDLFSKDVSVTGIPRTLANQVTEVYNAHYKEFSKITCTLLPSSLIHVSLLVTILIDRVTKTLVRVFSQGFFKEIN